MLHELPSFFIVPSSMPDSLTFVAWYFDDAQELKNLNHIFPGFIVFAHSGTNETTNAGDDLRILKILESENVHDTLVRLTQKICFLNPIYC